ncbi:hypothetical protein BD311DRAFT_764605 [Dichomitus squalens]|uniref:Uncharacterized protein n=1 Tax=Dichomitus squalens TaxID=114155 RepID=A0A4V2JZK7_9APHY|nr:hypothetical protein BD311DRAFT_764605 [Dichomitus squalens]
MRPVSQSPVLCAYGVPASLTDRPASTSAPALRNRPRPSSPTPPASFSCILVCRHAFFSAQLLWYSQEHALSIAVNSQVGYKSLRIGSTLHRNFQRVITLIAQQLPIPVSGYVKLRSPIADISLPATGESLTTSRCKRTRGSPRRTMVARGGLARSAVDLAYGSAQVGNRAAIHLHLITAISSEKE